MNLKNMFDFGYKRSFSEALVFYFLWCLLLVLFVLLLSFTLSFIYAVASVFGFLELAQIITDKIIGELSGYSTALICLTVTFLIIHKKKMYSLWSIFLFLINAFLCFHSSALYGFVFTSILTMFPNKAQLSVEN